MAKHILFIQGAGEGAYKEDAKLVDSLRQLLGSEYEIHYPAMPDEENAPYEQWEKQIGAEIASMEGVIILVGHSLGASALAKYLDDVGISKPITGIFLLAAPFWGGQGWRYEGYEELELSRDLTSKIPHHTPVYLYHSSDDEIVPFAHLKLYATTLPQATDREFDKGGHQFSNGLSVVANDIKALNQQ